MKLLSNQIANTHEIKFLDFEVNKQEREFLTPSRIRKLVKLINPHIDLGENLCLDVIE